MKNKLKQILGASLLFGALNVNAQSIFNGLRGPTEIQVDDRVSYSSREAQNGNKNEQIGNNLILKYWDGKERGVFGFVNMPYKEIESGDQTSKGLGDVSFGIGPRFERKVGENKLGILSYAGASLNTGDEKSKPALGTGRNDFKVGMLGTVLGNSGKYETDFAIDYTLTEGQSVSDEINGGIVLGSRLNKNFRGAVGPLFGYKIDGRNDGDYSLNGRVNFRFTPSEDLGKKMHLELWYDKFLTGHGSSASKDSDLVSLALRVNF